MRRRIPIPIGVQEYPHRHRPAGSQSAINMMPVAQAAGSKGPVVMQKVDAFNEVFANDSLGSNEPPNPSAGQFRDGLEIQLRVRGMRSIGAYLYFVVDGRVYRSNGTGGSTVSTGTVIAGLGRVWLANNATQLVIVNQSGNGYILTLSTMVVAAISHVDFQTPGWVVFMDQYFIFGKKDTPQFFTSAINDPTTYDPTEIATAESSPDNLLSGMRANRDLLLFGSESTEIWYNNAGVDFAFARAPDGALDVGIAAAHSAAMLDGFAVWLATEKGGRSIRRLSGRTPERISTQALDDELDSYTVVSDAFAMTWQMGGHSFYAITFPTVGRTWVYDAATNLWHRRRSRGLQFWRCGYIEAHQGKVYGMDLYQLLIRKMSRGQQVNQSGAYDPAYEMHTDIDSREIEWEMVTAPVATDRRPTTFNVVELEVDPGTLPYTQAQNGFEPAQVFLQWSDDDGRTWSNKFGRSCGGIGQFNSKLTWTNLGMTETGRVFKFSGGARALEAIIGATAEVTVGT